MARRSIPLPWTFVVATSTSDVFVPVTGWFAAQEIKKIAIVMEIVGLIGQTQIKRAYQTADSPSSADSATGVGSFVSANAVSYPSSSTDISATTEAKQLIRFGFIVSLATGSTIATASVAGRVDVIPS